MKRISIVEKLPGQDLHTAAVNLYQHWPTIVRSIQEGSVSLFSVKGSEITARLDEGGEDYSISITQNEGYCILTLRRDEVVYSLVSYFGDDDEDDDLTVASREDDIVKVAVQTFTQIINEILDTFVLGEEDLALLY